MVATPKPKAIGQPIATRAATMRPKKIARL
jgi:hypothetical protein